MMSLNVENCDKIMNGNCRVVSMTSRSGAVAFGGVDLNLSADQRYEQFPGFEDPFIGLFDPNWRLFDAAVFLILVGSCAALILVGSCAALHLHLV